MSARVFVTGASGFVGGAIARQLAENREVLAMSRSTGSDAAIAELGAMPVRCDLTTLTAEQLAGCDIVVHSAARVEPWGNLDDFWRDNVAGTAQMLRAARKAGVTRFVHIGTESALFHGQPMVDVDESAPLALDSPFPYSRTKAHAERLVRQANDPEAGFATIVLRPRFVWGPGDRTVLPTLIEMVRAGKFAWVDGGRVDTSTTHIDNLVAAVARALDHGVAGEAYFVLDDGHVQVRAFMTALAATRGVAMPDRSIPGWVARPVARLLALCWRLFRLDGQPPLDPFRAAVLSQPCTLNDSRARSELGYRPVVSREDGLAALGRGDDAQD